MSTSPNRNRSLHPSSRDLANELLLLRDSIEILVFGSTSASGPTAPLAGCAAATFATDRASMLALSQELRSTIKSVINHQPTVLATPLVSEHSTRRSSLSPTRRVQNPTNSAVYLQQSPSNLHVASPMFNELRRSGGSPGRRGATESLSELSRSYGVTVSELRANNPILSGYNDEEPLPANSPVRIPIHSATSDFASPTFGDVSRSVARNPHQGFHTTPQHGMTFNNSTLQSGATPSGPRGGSISLFNAPVERALETTSLHPMSSPLSPPEKRSTSPKRQHHTFDSFSPLRGPPSVPQSVEGRSTSSGDTLWALAKEYDVPVRELVRANPNLKAFAVHEVLPPRIIVAVPLHQ